MKTFEQKTKAIFMKYYGLLEKRRWLIEEDIAWDQVDKSQVSDEQKELIYIASLIESYTFTTTPQFLLQHRDKPWIMALQMARGYEECKHSHAQWRYLELLDFPVNSARLSEIQQEPNPTDGMELFDRNVYAWLSEVETGVFYNLMSQQLAEPVGKKLFSFISQDERVHGSFLFETLEAELSLIPHKRENLQKILYSYQHSEQESHYGAVIGAECFKKVRDWANASQAPQEIAKILSPKLVALMR